MVDDKYHSDDHEMGEHTSHAKGDEQKSLDHTQTLEGFADLVRAHHDATSGGQPPIEEAEESVHGLRLRTCGLLFWILIAFLLFVVGAVAAGLYLGRSDDYWQAGSQPEVDFPLVEQGLDDPAEDPAVAEVQQAHPQPASASEISGENSSTDQDALDTQSSVADDPEDTSFGATGDSGQSPSQDASATDPGWTSQPPLAEGLTIEIDLYDYELADTMPGASMVISVEEDGTVTGSYERTTRGTDSAGEYILEQTGSFTGSIVSENVIVASGSLHSVSVIQGKQFTNDYALTVEANPTSEDWKTWEVACQAGDGPATTFVGRVR